MSIKIKYVSSSLVCVVWKTKVKSNQRKKERFRLKLFKPCALYNAECALDCELVERGVFKIDLSFLWKSPFESVTCSSDSGSSDDDSDEEECVDKNLINPHRPCTVWFQFNGEKKWKLEKSTESPVEQLWLQSSRFVIPNAQSTPNSAEREPVPLTCSFWIEFETFNRGEKNSLKRFTKMFTEQTNCDVQFCFDGGKQIGAHSNILAAASPVFSAMFQHDMQEARSGKVNILDVQPNIFKEFLYYIYSGRILTSQTEDTAQSLFLLADKYDIADLKNECESFIVSSVRVDNAISMLIWADAHSITQVKEGVLVFMARQRHAKKLVKRSEWEELAKKNPALNLLAVRRMINNRSSS